MGRLAFVFLLISLSLAVAQKPKDQGETKKVLSKPNKFKCALFFKGPNTPPGKEKFLRTLPLELNAECVNGKVASPQLLEKYRAKCKTLSDTGLDGDYNLNSKSPIKNETGTIGNYWCTKFIARNGCGFEYAVHMSVCGGDYVDTNYRGPEPICCRWAHKLKKNINVPCTKWKPMKRGRAIPDACEKFVFPNGRPANKQTPTRPNNKQTTRPANAPRRQQRRRNNGGESGQ